MAAVEELRDSLQFMGINNVEEDILASMVETAAAVGMKPSEMGDGWIAYSLNHNSVALTFDNWMTYKTELTRSMMNRLNRKRPSVAVSSQPTSSPAFTPNRNFQSPLVSKTPLAPIHPSLYQQQDSSDVSSPMASDPATIGTTVFQFSLSGVPSDSPTLALEEKWWGLDTRPPAVDCEILKTTPNPFRYMLQKPSEVVLALNEHLELLEREAFSRRVEVVEGNEEPISEESKDNKPSQGSVENVTPESTRMVGRLVLTCSSNEAHEGNGSGVSLQGSLDSSSGTETPLHVLPSSINGFSICQGQVVAVNGTAAQTAKRLFVVERMLLPALPPPYVSSLASKDKDFVALIAAGPFTLPGQKTINLSSLTTVMRRFNPSVVILVGPFVSNGTCRMLMEKLQGVSSFPPLFCFVPQHSDPAADSPPVFPTPPLDKEANSKKPKKEDPFEALLPSDPAIFDVNGSLICATSIDVLKHLATSELHLGAPGAGGGGDRLVRLASTLIYQRSMYPLYPQAPSVPVDWPLWRKISTIPNLPSIVILPSDLNPFIAPFVQSGSCADIGGPTPAQYPLLVNPGRISRRRAAVVRWSAKDQAFTAGRIIRT